MTYPVRRNAPDDIHDAALVSLASAEAKLRRETRKGQESPRAPGVLQSEAQYRREIFLVCATKNILANPFFPCRNKCRAKDIIGVQAKPARNGLLRSRQSNAAKPFLAAERLSKTGSSGEQGSYTKVSYAYQHQTNSSAHINKRIGIQK